MLVSTQLSLVAVDWVTLPQESNSGWCSRSALTASGEVVLGTLLTFYGGYSQPSQPPQPQYGQT